MALKADRFEIDLTPEVKVFTPDIHGLIAWLETQDGTKEYNYTDSSDCLISRFVRDALGRTRRNNWIGYGFIYYGGALDFDTEQQLLRIASEAYCFSGDYVKGTYDAALTRARSLLDRSA